MARIDMVLEDSDEDAFVVSSQRHQNPRATFTGSSIEIATRLPDKEKEKKKKHRDKDKDRGHKHRHEVSDRAAAPVSRGIDFFQDASAKAPRDRDDAASSFAQDAGSWGQGGPSRGLGLSKALGLGAIPEGSEGGASQEFSIPPQGARPPPVTFQAAAQPVGGMAVFSGFGAPPGALRNSSSEEENVAPARPAKAPTVVSKASTGSKPKSSKKDRDKDRDKDKEKDRKGRKKRDKSRARETAMMYDDRATEDDIRSVASYGSSSAFFDDENLYPDPRRRGDQGGRHFDGALGSHGRPFALGGAGGGGGGFPTVLSAAEASAAKTKLLNDLAQWEMSGEEVAALSVNNSLEEIQGEVDRITACRASLRTLRFSRRAFMFSVYMLEYGNARWDPLGVDLDGYGEHAMTQLDDYDDIFLQLAEKYGGEGQMGPELNLLLTLGGSIAMWHMQHNLFKNAGPSITEFARQNPMEVRKLMEDHARRGSGKGGSQPGQPMPGMAPPGGHPTMYMPPPAPMAMPTPMPMPPAPVPRSPMAPPPQMPGVYATNRSGNASGLIQDAEVRLPAPPVKTREPPRPPSPPLDPRAPPPGVRPMSPPEETSLHSLSNLNIHGLSDSRSGFFHEPRSADPGSPIQAVSTRFDAPVSAPAFYDPNAGVDPVPVPSSLNSMQLYAPATQPRNSFLDGSDFSDLSDDDQEILDRLRAQTTAPTATQGSAAPATASASSPAPRKTFYRKKAAAKKA